MDTDERGRLFAALLGLEFKGAIVAQGRTANWVAHQIGIERATLNRYLNGHNAMRVSTLALASEAIDTDPGVLVARAYARYHAARPSIAQEMEDWLLNLTEVDRTASVGTRGSGEKREATTRRFSGERDGLQVEVAHFRAQGKMNLVWAGAGVEGEFQVFARLADQSVIPMSDPFRVTDAAREGVLTDDWDRGDVTTLEIRRVGNGGSRPGEDRQS
jgi:hypothetical protein